MSFNDEGYDIPCSGNRILPVNQFVNITKISLHGAVNEMDSMSRDIRLYDTITESWYNRFCVDDPEILRQYGHIMTTKQREKFEYLERMRN